MAKTVTIVDYGVGNLYSVSRAIETISATASVEHHPDKICNADYLILPGVGAFESAMRELGRRDLKQAVLRFAERDRPMLGICLGMQMMLEVSEEFGTHQGLALIPGNVVAVPNTGANGRPHKVPHIGWSALTPPTNEAWHNSILAEIAPESCAYFVHSYCANPLNPAHALAYTSYNGRKICAVIGRDNLYGCQFHPEKSGRVGLDILRGFLSL